jgi:hypothetical protein
VADQQSRNDRTAMMANWLPAIVDHCLADRGPASVCFSRPEAEAIKAVLTVAAVVPGLPDGLPASIDTVLNLVSTRLDEGR